MLGCSKASFGTLQWQKLDANPSTFIRFFTLKLPESHEEVVSLRLAEYGYQVGFEATNIEFDRSALTNWATLPEILIIISYNTISYNDDNGGVSV